MLGYLLKLTIKLSGGPASSQMWIFPFLSALSDTVKKSEQAYHTAVNNPITAETSRHTYNSKLYTIMIIVQQFNSSKSQLETKRRRKSPLVCHFYARPRSSCKYVNCQLPYLTVTLSDLERRDSRAQILTLYTNICKLIPQAAPSDGQRPRTSMPSPCGAGI